MGDKVYILLDIADGKAEQVAQVLRESPGVVNADTVEGPPDVVIVMGAPTREQLAKWTVEALATVDALTEQVCLLPARDRSIAGAFSELSSQSRCKNRSKAKREV